MMTGLLVWHIAVAGLILVLHQLSVRLGRALSDNDRYLPLYLVGASILLVAGILWAMSGVWSAIVLWAQILDIVGGGIAAVAGWSYWSWLPAEIRKTRRK
ncbi:MAG: hypothetical protein RL318_1428 [Fibrobacterota bacterium]|jgi:hypothetical protein